jgi:hypothetical protein
LSRFSTIRVGSDENDDFDSEDEDDEHRRTTRTTVSDGTEPNQ